VRFRFDANQEFQIQAIEAVTDLFDGQGRVTGGMQFQQGALALAAVGNRLDLDDGAILSNLRDVQARNGIHPDDELKVIEAPIDTAGGPRTARFANFSVDMETGTGKTYVYIRTILELNKRYGMRKFIIVVPSIAIREGVLKTLRITEEHFRRLYGNPVYRYYVYDSANLTQVRQFALSDAVEVMVMTIASFNRAANVMRRMTDRLQGETPVHLVQAARPILILDEPQNMESETSIAALALLDPLFALRYSATHRNPYNLVYRLTPAEAYRQGLVKKVEVDSVVREGDEMAPYVCVLEVRTQKTRVSARLRVHKLMASGVVRETTMVVKPGDSLEAKTGRREYEGYDVDEINPGGQFVRFANNIELALGAEHGADREALFAVQIRHTIEEHFRKQARLRARGIKVLTLFFIDRVANYAGDDPLIPRLFDQAFNELKVAYEGWGDVDPADVRAAYFAERRRRGGVVELVDSTEGRDRTEDQAAYDLIMRDKETLLTFPSPEDDDEERKRRQVAFIFSHSALREGWDNPNVFQICTLNQTVSATKKRQEVGRGVRLAVDQEGSRVHDERVNILTVVANESYAVYVATYQSEIAAEYQAEIEARYGKSLDDLTDAERVAVEQEYGEGILPPKPRRAGQRKAKLRKARALSDDFQELWSRIKHRTRYAVTIDTEQVLQEVVPELEHVVVSRPRITITKASMAVDDDGMFEALQVSAARAAADLVGRYPLPNLVEVMANLMEHTSPPVRLTRRTLLELFKRVENKQAALDNPHEWACAAVRILKDKLADHLVKGIKYIRVADCPDAQALPESGRWYEMRRILADEEVEIFAQYIEPTDDTSERSLYDLVPCDSEVERRFVQQLEAREDVRLYLKLPYWFTVPTPVGEYRPDWAVVMENPEEGGEPLLYLVAETKDPPDPSQLRPHERRKIACGAAHFGSKQFKKRGALEGVDYKVVSTADDLP